MGNLEDQFNRTILTFKNRLEPKELVEIQCRSLAELNDVISQIQRRQRDQKAMMNLNRIKIFLEAMDQFEQTVKVFVNTSDMVAYIWGPIKLLLSVANTWADAFDELLDAYEQIGEHMPLLQQYQSLFHANPHMQAVLGMMFDDIVAFHTEAVRFFAKSVFKQLWKSFWKSHESRFRHLLDALLRHRRLIEEQASVVHFLQYQRDRDRILDAFDDAEETRRLNRHKDVMQWLCSNDNIVNYEAACRARNYSQTTGTWILEDSKIQEWKDKLEPSNPVLWLNGIPGAGKSVLASVIIQNCLEREKQGATATFQTSYFYCSSDNVENTTTCIAVLRGLIAQLLVANPDLLVYCHEKFTKSRETVLSSMQQAKQLFELFCDANPRLGFIIDGLDECMKLERKALLEYLTPLVEKTNSNSPGKLRLLVISQQDGDLRKLLSNAAVLTLSVELNGEDIRNYVNHRMFDIGRQFGVSDEISERVVNTTCSRASDMFLFAKLVLNNLSAQPNQQSFLAEIELDIFPDTLSAAYARILSNIKSRAQSHNAWLAAVQLLGWMSCARRPMRWHEIQAAASIDNDSEGLTFDTRKFRHHASELCGALILELPGHRLTLVHATARTHIVRNQYINLFQVERSLTTLCLQYLSFKAFDVDTNDEELRDLIGKGQLAFHEYATVNCLVHFLEFARAGSDYLDSPAASINLLEPSLPYEHPEDFMEFESAFDEFTKLHDLGDQEIPEDEYRTAAHECRAFAESHLYPDLQQLWIISKRHATAALDVRNKPCLPSLGTALFRGREMIEKLSTTSKELSKHLDEYYGTTRFKCTKLTCHWFHVGFGDEKTRKAHVAKHERPFVCSVEDCSAADIGFMSSKQLEKHERMFHPNLDDKGEIFKPLKAAPTKTPFACTIPGCDRRFTRKFHLTSHIRNHNQEKPFACNQCGREFTRANDCRRHERTIHSRRG